MIKNPNKKTREINSNINKTEKSLIFNANLKNKKEEKKSLIHYPSSVREWKNSVYFYNHNNLNLIPFSAGKAMKIIKSFFSLYNKFIEKKIRKKRLLLRLRRLSSNRIYLSDGEFKHKNNSVLINIYVFNRQRYNYMHKLKDIYLKKFFLNFKKKKFLRKKLWKQELKMDKIKRIKLLKFVNLIGLSMIKKINKKKTLLIKALSIVEKNQKYKINNFKSLSDYSLLFYKRLLRKKLRKLRLFFFFKQLMYINRSKLNYTYLRILKKHLENLFNKNVEFNLVNLKRFYLNSDILYESVRLKLTRNKKKMRKIFNKLKRKIKKHEISLIADKTTKNKLREYKPNYLKALVFKNLKYKRVTGFRIESKGRLSRRFTASRSVYKEKYDGNLLNMDSSFKGISTVMLRGNLRSNLQYTTLKSKTKIGSFGIKGWVSGN